MTFSLRMGLVSTSNLVQTEHISNELRNVLWNCLDTHYFCNLKKTALIKDNLQLHSFYKSMWNDFLKQPYNSMPVWQHDLYKYIYALFYKFNWYQVYDFIEFVVNTHSLSHVNERFINDCNKMLKRELSAYRFVDKQLVKVTSDEEIESIRATLDCPDAFSPIKTHISSALSHLSNRSNPDYRNSIKESISAVESTCMIITKRPDATLGQALSIIESSSIAELHPALKGAFSKLYGYTNDAEGIRHALLDEPNLDFEDAKFMVVACSAFINYLIDKYNKANA